MGTLATLSLDIHQLGDEPTVAGNVNVSCVWLHANLIHYLPHVALGQVCESVQVPAMDAIVPAAGVEDASIWAARHGIDNSITAL